jgi:oxalate decarboxylase/phosphoglucose isomerase-like protein (cupin superfamily)
MIDLNGRRFIEPKHVETQVFDWGRIQWMSEPRVTGTERMTAGIVTLEVGKGHQRHNHPNEEELLFVVQGDGIQMIDIDGEERRQVSAGTMIQIPVGIYHSTVNTGDQPMILFVVYSPPGPEAFLRSLPDCRIEPPVDANAP